MPRSRKSLRSTKAFAREFAWWQKNFGAVVKEQRLKAKLSRRELAKRAKFSVSTLVHIEQVRSRLSSGDSGCPCCIQGIRGRPATLFDAASRRGLGRDRPGG